jgi:DNA-binding transcriptional ArsR family regulator
MENKAFRDPLSETFAALADPTRRAILARLSQGQGTISELAEPFLESMSLPAITKHVKVLERAGLVTKSKDAQFRPCTLNDAPLQDAADWLETYRVLWEERFDRLADFWRKTAPEAEGAARVSRGRSARRGAPRGSLRPTHRGQRNELANTQRSSPSPRKRAKNARKKTV